MMKFMTTQKLSAGELRSLNTYLLACNDSMSVVKAHGFMTAILSFPEVITPSEWLPAIIGDDPEFCSEGHAEYILGSIMHVYNHVAAGLQHNRPFSFILSAEQPQLGLQKAPEACIQEWCEGYCKALSWNEMAWFQEEESIVAKTCAVFFLLAKIFKPEDILKSHKIVTNWEKEKHTLITDLPVIVKGLSRFWWATRQGTHNALNDWEEELSCLCGSGRHYMRCCFEKTPSKERVLH